MIETNLINSDAISDDEMRKMIMMKRNRRKRTESRLRARGIETWVKTKDRMALLEKLFRG
jgi:hypothetical protein